MNFLTENVILNGVYRFGYAVIYKMYADKLGYSFFNFM